MTKTKLSIIVVNWNTKVLLKQCLDSLVQSAKFMIQSYKIEVIIIDNGSSDGSVDVIQKSKFKYQNQNVELKTIFNRENVGFAKANNQGIKVAKGEYIMLLNSDTIAKENALGVLVDYLENNPNTAISPSLILPNGHPQNDHYMKFPNPWHIILYHNPLLRPLAVRFKIIRNILFNSTKNRNGFLVDQLPGAALVASKETWNEVGELDETYKFFFEDVDWSWRAMQKGIKRVIVPAAKIIHLGGASWKHKLRENKSLIYQQNFGSMLLFCKKNYTHINYQFMRWLVVANMFITLKFNLAWYFIKTPTKQTDLW